MNWKKHDDLLEALAAHFQWDGFVSAAGSLIYVAPKFGAWLHRRTFGDIYHDLVVLLDPTDKALSYFLDRGIREYVCRNRLAASDSLIDPKSEVSCLVLQSQYSSHQLSAVQFEQWDGIYSAKGFLKGVCFVVANKRQVPESSLTFECRLDFQTLLIQRIQDSLCGTPSSVQPFQLQLDRGSVLLADLMIRYRERSENSGDRSDCLDPRGKRLAFARIGFKPDTEPYGKNSEGHHSGYCKQSSRSHVVHPEDLGAILA